VLVLPAKSFSYKLENRDKVKKADRQKELYENKLCKIREHFPDIPDEDDFKPQRAELIQKHC
jgi:hypothetical protein